MGSLIERRQILGVLKQASPDGGVDQIGETPVGFGRFHAEGAVQVRIQVHGGSPRFAHRSMMSERRRNVKTS